MNPNAAGALALLGLGFTAWLVTRRDELVTVDLIPGALKPPRPPAPPSSSSSRWPGREKWGEPRVPADIAGAVETAKRSGWFPEGNWSALADQWALLTNLEARDAQLYLEAFEDEAASPERGSVLNAPAWADIWDALTAFNQCDSNGFCQLSTKYPRLRRDLSSAANPWRRAGLMLVVTRGLQSQAPAL